MDKVSRVQHDGIAADEPCSDNKKQFPKQIPIVNEEVTTILPFLGQYSKVLKKAKMLYRHKEPVIPCLPPVIPSAKIINQIS